MISWGWASTMTSVMFTWYSFSMTGMIQLNPALANLLYLPSLSIRPRWVGRTIRMPLRKKTTTTMAMMGMRLIMDSSSELIHGRGSAVGGILP